MIEDLAQEDTRIKQDHIAQIKELVKKELTLEEKFTEEKAVASE